MLSIEKHERYERARHKEVNMMFIHPMKYQIYMSVKQLIKKLHRKNKLKEAIKIREAYKAFAACLRGDYTQKTKGQSLVNFIRKHNF